jgi:peptidoglycan hydrolase-like protein with peptidoglycan-binding domain
MIARRPLRGILWVAVLCLSAATAFSPSRSAAQAPKPAPATPQKSGAGKTAAPASPASKQTPAKKPAKRRTTRRRGQAAPTADRIREIQAALAKSGHYQGEPTGKWDAATTSAMKSFQQANDLKPTGKLDALSLQKLGLGSATAGVAPPRPAVATSANSGPSLPR